MKFCNKQRGATLVISLIMLVVVTMLVVYSIRSGNTNLRIAGNMQSQEEAVAATQAVIEKVIEQIKVTDNITLITAQTVTLPTGGVAASVTPVCRFSVPVLNETLNSSNANDIPCFASQDVDLPIKSDGTMSSKPSSCKQQTWEIQASVADTATGASVTQIQGLAIRVPTTVACPA